MWTASFLFDGVQKGLRKEIWLRNWNSAMDDFNRRVRSALEDGTWWRDWKMKVAHVRFARDHFLRKFKIVSNNNRVVYICPSSPWMKIESVYLLHERRETFLGFALLEFTFASISNRPHRLYRKCSIFLRPHKKILAEPQKVSNFASQKCPYQDDFFVVISRLVWFVNICVRNGFFYVLRKNTEHVLCRRIVMLMHKPRIGLNRKWKCVDKVIIALTMCDTFRIKLINSCCSHLSIRNFAKNKSL